MMMWLLLATGFTGAFTLRFLYRQLVQLFVVPPAVAVHFSPKGGCTEVVVAELKNARKEVLVQAYSFTSKPLAQALVDAKMRGVNVEVVLDKSHEGDKYSDLEFFLEQGLHPLIDASHAIAHNKIMIIDRQTLLTGSFNFTHQAEVENAENLLVIKGHPDLIRAYRENFVGHKAHARTPEMKAPSAQPRGAEHRTPAVLKPAEVRLHPTAAAPVPPPHLPSLTAPAAGETHTPAAPRRAA